VGVGDDVTAGFVDHAGARADVADVDNGAAGRATAFSVAASSAVLLMWPNLNVGGNIESTIRAG
jgi:hypothetical protein